MFICVESAAASFDFNEFRDYYCSKVYVSSSVEETARSVTYLLNMTWNKNLSEVLLGKPLCLFLPSGCWTYTIRPLLWAVLPACQLWTPATSLLSPHLSRTTDLTTTPPMTCQVITNTHRHKMIIQIKATTCNTCTHGTGRNWARLLHVSGAC